MPTLSIIVVNYNGSAHLEECLSALRDQVYPDYEVLLVDNNSTDNSLSIVCEYFSWVRLICSSVNLGYSGAVNIALSQANGRYIAVLNMDTIVTSDWVRPMINFLELNLAVGAVTPKIVLYDQPNRINALGQNIHITALGFNRAYNQPNQTQNISPFPVAGIHGAAFLIRRDLLERMGGMNATCFLYHEEVDLSWLVRLMGYQLYCIPQSVVRHKYTLKMDAQKLFYLERNRVAMLLTHLSWSTLLLLVPFLALTELMMALYCILKGADFIRAKSRSLRWLWNQRRHIRQRRRHIQSLRCCHDLQVLTCLHIMYEWDQLITLGRQSQPHNTQGCTTSHLSKVK